MQNFMKFNNLVTITDKIPDKKKSIKKQQSGNPLFDMMDIFDPLHSIKAK